MHDLLRIIHEDGERFGGSNRSGRRNGAEAKDLRFYVSLPSPRNNRLGKDGDRYRLGRGTRKPTAMLEMFYIAT